jgi:hypothetical protein
MTSHLLPIPLTELAGEALDRRRRPRLRLAYSLRLRRPGATAAVETTTEDISCEGFYCISPLPFAPDEKLECELVIPTEEPGHPLDLVVLRCRARVIRVVKHKQEALLPGRLHHLSPHCQDFQIRLSWSRPPRRRPQLPSKAPPNRPDS